MPTRIPDADSAELVLGSLFKYVNRINTEFHHLHVFRGAQKKHFSGGDSRLQPSVVPHSSLLEKVKP
jgi:hypothetical protein